MATLQFEDIADLVLATRTDEDKGKWTDLTGDYQEYHAMPNILKGDKIKFKKGKDITVNLMTSKNGNFRFVGMREVDVYNSTDALAKGTAPWRHWNFNYSWDEREEEINSGEDVQILDLVESRRAQAFLEAAEELEIAFWSKPASSSDEKTMWGIGNYIVKNASEGFNGGNPTGYTTGCIFDSTVQTRWKNWTAQYTNITKTDLVRKLRKASTKTKFKAPVQSKSMRSGEIRRALYTNYDVISEVEELVELGNENLGNDVAKYDGDAHFRKMPLLYVPYLDDDSQDPIYGVDWSTFVPFFMEGQHFKEGKPTILKGTQHKVMAVDIDCSGNIVCYNRRSQFVVNKA